MISFATFSPGFMSDLQKKTMANNFTLLINCYEQFILITSLYFQG